MTIGFEADVSRETMERLKAFAELALHWTKTINIVARSTQDEIWERHILDSLQLSKFASWDAQSWIDLGSGGGFPGIVIAIWAKEVRPGLKITLVESDQRKSVFLKTVARELDLSTEVKPERIEDLPDQPFDIVSARALAPLPKLLSYAGRFQGPGTKCLFLKGRSLDSELTALGADWHIAYRTHPSITNPDASVLEISEFRRRI